MKHFDSLLLLLLCALPGRSQTAGNFISVVQSNFVRWDVNHDGVLSSEEISVAMTDAAVTNEAAAAVTALKRASRSKKNPVPPLTLTNIARLAEQARPEVVRMYQEDLRRIASATNRALFAGGQPKLETIHQGEMGNCFCLAPLGAMVYRDPAEVMAMFSPATNCGYAVKLGKQTVTVAPPTDAEIALSSSNERNGIWVNVYEKAAGTALNAEKPVEQRAASPLDALAKGGSAGTMLAYITGHDMKRFSFKFAKDAALSAAEFQAKLAELRPLLKQAVADKRLMTCGTIKPTTPGLTPHHAYAVLGYDAAADTVELWNPHGRDFSPAGAPGSESGYVTKKGVFRIPVEQFVRQFGGMAFEGKEERRAERVMR